jgi:hypothetical protein
MTYTRVIPRDLFNEAKLLKCLGQLALLIRDGKAPEFLTVDEPDGDGFVIEQNPGDGALYCANLTFRANGRQLPLYAAYNSKDPYPLLCDIDGEETAVFYDDGTLTTEFYRYTRSRHCLR